MSIPRSKSRSSTFRRLSGTRTYISTTSRITSGDESKYRNGVAGLRGRGIHLPYPLELTSRCTWFDRALKTYASEHGRSLLELAISWLTSQPHVASVIAGATRPDQVRANVEANCWKLSEEDFAAVAAIIAPDPS
jgi:aryl-alcohol dehydrogenase-like predicted oxidoreductase